MAPNPGLTADNLRVVQEDAGLSGLSSAEEIDYSTSSISEGRDRHASGDFRGNEYGSEIGMSKRSGVSETGKKVEENMYGAEGDLLYKGLVVALLVMIGTAAGFVFLYGLISGDLSSAAKFDEYMEHLEKRAQDTAIEMNGGLATWGVHVSSYAMLHAGIWPFHQFAHFTGMTEQYIGNTRTLEFTPDSQSPAAATKVQFVATAPLVHDEIRATWEVYATRGSSGNNVSTSAAAQVVEIHGADPASGQAVVVETGTGPYTPLFQMHVTDPALEANMSSSSSSSSLLLNFDLLQIPAFARAFSLVEHAQQPVLSEPIMINPNMTFLTEILGDTSEPYCILVNPIIGGNHTTATNSKSPKTVVGAMVGFVPYRAFFENILPTEAKGVALVARPSATCQERHADLPPYTFQMNPEGTVDFTAAEDKHDASYNFHETVIPWDPFLVFRSHREDFNSSRFLTTYEQDMLSGRGGDNATVYCQYELRAYPSDAFYSVYRSNTPRLFAGFLVAIFVFVMGILSLYNTIMRRKDKMAHMAVQRSNAIVDMFFPQEVKDRLMDEQQDDGDGGAKNAFQANAGNRQMIPAGDGFDPNRFLDDKPIASLFPETTVIFADIAGFTAWSSEREPSQVFILLETIYGEFDRIAKKKKVFKVETIGDCYLAVTGIPDPQKDHAVIMCQFARECMSKMYEVTAALELTLGPDTSDLAMRMGLHSGPVTAGVLRGRKSHFQLFGDTVNTAARMESTGMREKIQVSQETADLLKAAGRSNWVKARDKMVEAKGKGSLPTFWLLPRAARAGSTLSSATSMSRSSSVGHVQEDQSSQMDEDDSPSFALPGAIAQAMPGSSSANKSKQSKTKELSSKSKRLVQWNVALLTKLLKQVAASRNTFLEEPEKLAALEKRLVEKSSILDEVQESIAVSKTGVDTKGKKDAASTVPNKGTANPDNVFIPDDVVSQLTEYVSKIALLHPENPFHNFEHASHVTMSTSKLLSRIVNADAAGSKSASTFNAGDIQLSGAHKKHAHSTSYGITSDPLTQFSVVFSALIHDVDHPGVSNAILMNEDAALGEKYKNKSVAEQKSLDVAWKLLMQPQYEELRHCIYTNEKQLMQFRQLLVNSLIATDIFDRDHGQFRKTRWAKAFEEDAEAVSGDTTSITSLDRKATIVIEHLIQASDVSHTMQHWHVYQKWNARLFEEMHVAFKTGRSQANPALNWYKGELWFFDNYVIPLAKKLETCGVFGVSSDEFLTYATENRKEWATKGEQIVEEMLSKVEPQDHDLENSRHIRNEDD